MADEITRAQNIIAAYAEGIDALTKDECADEGFSKVQCNVLVGALGKGADGGVTSDESAQVLVTI